MNYIKVSMDAMMKKMVAGFSSSRVNEGGLDSNCRNNFNQSSEGRRFKGLVRHKNGHWGAQIYANHERTWLGTFKSEKEAAMAYDSASVKLRGRDHPHRNFPLNDLTIEEPNFQELHSKESILHMIKDGTYESMFMDFLQTRRSKMENAVELKLCKRFGNHGRYSCQQLFQKKLTPSDVGDLNRIVIPKKRAIKYFPPLPEFNPMQLEFFDRQRKSWKFKYCYWQSSKSYVFTKGWKWFVKEKKLQVDDVITFYRRENPQMPREHQILCMIDVEKNAASISNVTVEEPAGHGEIIMGQRVDFGWSFKSESDRAGRDQEEMVVMSLGPPQQEGKKIVRLFGVQIN